MIRVIVRSAMFVVMTAVIAVIVKPSPGFPGLAPGLAILGGYAYWTWHSDWNRLTRVQSVFSTYLDLRDKYVVGKTQIAVFTRNKIPRSAYPFCQPVKEVGPDVRAYTLTVNGFDIDLTKLVVRKPGLYFLVPRSDVSLNGNVGVLWGAVPCIMQELWQEPDVVLCSIK